MDANETAGEEFLASIIQDSTFKEAPKDLREACEAARDAENQELMDVFGLSDLSELYGEDYSPEDELDEYVNERMVICTIAAKEKLSVTDEEYRAALEEEMATSDYLTVEEYESEMVPDPEEYKYSLLRSKVLSFLLENNTLNDIDADEYYADEEFLDEEDIDVDVEEYDSEAEAETE